MYTKPDQTPFAANLAPHEFVVQLDTGEYVALDCEMSVQEHSGDPVITAKARVVNADGTDATDSNGQTIKTGFSQSQPQTIIDSYGGIAAWQKIACMAVLGESTEPAFMDPIHATELINWSIRTNIASAKHAGPVSTLSSII